MPAPTSVLGYVDDSRTFGGLLVDVFETIPDLAWPSSTHTYAQMRHDPQLQGILKAYTLPLRRASWSVDPAGCRPEVAQLVADDLGLPLLGADETPAAARRRGISWAEHLRLATLELVFGHMPFERRYEVLGTQPGQTRLRALSERMPSTIQQILIGDDGALAGIQQHPRLLISGESVKGPPPIIGVDRLVWYAHEREGAAWWGTSVLRPAYGAWLIKRELWRITPTMLRRNGMGIPEVTAPPGGTPAQVAEAQRLASAIRVGEQAGMGLPNGFTVKFRGVEGTLPDALPFIEYLDQQMSRMALAGMLDLGNTPNGSRALGESFIDLFLFALQAVAEQIAATATTGLAVDMVNLNWGEDEPAPQIIVGDIGADNEVTAQSLQLLMQSGALAADPELEAYVRREWNLPERAAAPPVAVPALPAPPAKPTVVPVAAASAPRRQPTVVEASAGTDFAAVQDDWQAAVDAAVAAWVSKIGLNQQDQLVEQVRAAVAANDPSALSNLTVDSTEALDLLTSSMDMLAAAAVDQMTQEATSQGVTVRAGAAPDSKRLEQYAETIVNLIGGGLAASAARKALQLWTPGSTPAEVAAGVGDHLASLTEASLRDNLGAGLSAAQNEGRLAVLRKTPPARYFASEYLDVNTCAPCSAIDGHEFNTLNDAEQSYSNGGYSLCSGGLRCRGILVSVWDQAKAA